MASNGQAQVMQVTDLPAAADAVRLSRSDRFRALLGIYDALLGPLPEDTAAAAAAHHPAVLEVKHALEQRWLAELEHPSYPLPSLGASDVTDAVRAMRALAARNRIPAAYRWVATDADRDQLVAFLAAEGGPDGGFDDLVAVAQLGLSGEAKLELATNYWDELGNGAPEHVHTDLHRRTCEVLGIEATDPDRLSESALERAALGGLLASNHWLQPELLGALGMIELQAGPRCQQVLSAMRRLGLPAEAQEFYLVHAQVDPRHGADWMTHVIAPLTAQRPSWSARVLRGAQWRIAVNDRFLAEQHALLAGADQAVAA